MYVYFFGLHNPYCYRLSSSSRYHRTGPEADNSVYNRHISIGLRMSRRVGGQQAIRPGPEGVTSFQALDALSHGPNDAAIGQQWVDIFSNRSCAVKLVGPDNLKPASLGVSDNPRTQAGQQKPRSPMSMNTMPGVYSSVPGFMRMSTLGTLKTRTRSFTRSCPAVVSPSTPARTRIAIKSFWNPCPKSPPGPW